MIKEDIYSNNSCWIDPPNMEKVEGATVYTTKNMVSPSREPVGNYFISNTNTFSKPTNDIIFYPDNENSIRLTSNGVFWTGFKNANEATKGFLDALVKSYPYYMRELAKEVNERK